jgi:hypothetical protein
MEIVSMYHTRPILTYDLMTAIQDRISDQLADPEPSYDMMLSEMSKEDLKRMLGHLINFVDSYLEKRDG